MKAPLVVFVDDTLRAHVVRALAEHRRWLRSNRLPAPAALDALLDALAGPVAALGGQQRSSLDVGAEGGDGGAVLLTYEDAGRRLAVSPRTVRRLVAAGRLPAVRLGRSVRIRAAELDRFAGEVA